VESVLLDTNLVSYLMRGDSRAELYRHHLEGKTLAVSFMTVAELYEGAYRRGWREDRMSRLEALIRNYVVVPFSNRTCQIWGRVRTERRHQPI
jgi:tRNA(fMet)-specific endonuclease VapC